MATEYIFFDPDLRERFAQIVATHGLACATREDAIEGHVVQLVDEPDDDVLAALEQTYEELLQEQMLRAEDRADWGSHQAVSLHITRADGSPAQVRLPPAVARPLMENFTAEQAHDLVQAIAHSLENPLDGPLCRKDLLQLKP